MKTFRKIFARMGAWVLPSFCMLSVASAGAVTLADSPLFSSVTVPGNVALTLSVEWPTATTPAYPSTVSYSSSSEYLGYFDPAKCYKYSYNSTTPASSYFAPYSAASSHACTSSSTVPLWSGNYLNWASMQTLDAFRWVLTGGYRSVDSTSQTILTKTNATYDNTVMPQKTVSGTTTVSGATPFNWSSITTRLRVLGTRMWITGSSSNSTMTESATSGATAYQSQTSSCTSTKNSSCSTATSSTTYEVYINVQVCSTSVSVESNCVLYGSGYYKPEGLMQQYSDKLRFAAFSYLTDSTVTRDGGVLRAPMKYIGPTQPVPGSSSVTNSAAEWSSTTGVMVTNPDSSLATSTTSASKTAGYSVTISKSGVMNYLNQFGYTTTAYKSKDPVSELYYAAVRYFKNLGNVSTYSTLSGAGSTSNMTNWLDGFPVAQTWEDPIQYSCQKNFILGIGDDNTWYDANLYGSTIRSSSELSLPSAVSSDTSVNVKTATDMVGTLEGVSGLGSANASSMTSTNRYDTYFIAGLAYDSHTKDIRSDLSGTQTINTYWMDVLEGQYYQYRNIYYYATKYGGFTVPDGFEPYASTNSSSTLGSSAWHTNSDTLTDASGTTYNGKTNSRPDNYFPGNEPDLMQTGLTTAFEKITSELSVATTTAFSSVTRTTSTSGGGSYSAAYDPSSWTGKVIGSTISYNTDGSTSTTQVWDARSLLQDTAYTDRKIVTCCTSAGAGLAFEYSTLNAATLNSRTLFSSFSSVPNVATASQSAKNFVNYLRGDSANEATNGGVYRTRSYRLGDIVGSKATPVSAPSATYYDSTNPGYSTFKLKYASRKTVVYAGANDGMMHAFDGSLSGTSMGTELFAYIPSFAYGDSSSSSDRYYATYGLASLGNSSFTHHYMVNATPVSYDMDLNNTSGADDSTQDWRSVVIGGMGKGGKGYYAIDVTDPSAWTSESAVAGKVLWEFTSSHMGYTFGEPVVAKTAKYGWVVIFPSGYNNDDGKGYLFIVNPKSGSLLESIVTPEGSTSSPINMAQIRGFVSDYTDYTVDAVYGGDLRGNVWRFDLTGTSTYSSPTKIAELTNAAGTALPITTKPLIGVDGTTSKRYVMFGTGQLLSDEDIDTSTLQGFFAIVDGTGSSGGFYTSSTLPTGESFPVVRSNLNAVTDLTVGVDSSASASVMGWYYDFSSSDGIAERMNVDGDVYSSMVAFAANLPNGDVCNPSGSSREFVVKFASGKSALVNNDGDVVESISNTNGTATEVVFQNIGGTVSVVVGDSSGATTTLSLEQDLPTLKRLNWREISTVN